jgi:hypothetical protein
VRLGEGALVRDDVAVRAAVAEKGRMFGSSVCTNVAMV